MGKRELVLIAVFAVVGVLLYQFTAPPLPPGQQGFSFSRVFNEMRRGISGRRFRAVVDKSRTEPIDSSITELRINIRIVELKIVGEDRADTLFETRVDSNGADDAEAKQLAERTTLKVDHAGVGLVATMDFPPEGTQHAALTVHVPKRLAVRVESKSGRLEIGNVASVDVKGNRGETKVSDVAGDVNLSHRGGDLVVDRVGSLRLDQTMGAATVSRVKGVCSVNVTRGDLNVTDVVGPLDLKSVGAEIKLRDIASLKPPFRADMQSGSLDVEGLRTEARVDGRDTGIRIALDRAVPLTIYSTADDIRITPAAGGYTVDATATGGHVTIEDGALKPAGDDREQRANGAVRGGGPTMMLRATRADITVAKAGGSKQ
jgi:hypothetical protein